MVPAPSGPYGNLESQLHVILRPLAHQAGLTMTGPCNLGESEGNFRVPDSALHRHPPTGVWNPTAALVVEILSPGDETWEKLPFYAAHQVDEVLIVDPQEHSISCLALTGDKYRQVNHSGLLDLEIQGLAEHLEWPTIETA
jgi:Uma2 family endonuclease